MNANEIVRALKEMLPPQVDYAELVCSPVPSSYGVCYVWENPEPYHISAAIDLIESLQAENERLAIHGGRYMQLADERYKMFERAIKRADDAETQLSASQRRADAAVEDLESLHGENSLCRICKHFNVDVECSPCADCKGNPHIIVSEFEWRGTEKGEADERD